MKDEKQIEDTATQSPQIEEGKPEAEQNGTHSASDGQAAAPAAAAAGGRSDGVTLLAVYHFLLAGFFLLGTVGTALPAVITAVVGVVEEPDALIATFILGIIATLLMLFTILFLAVGYGLWTRRQWARIASLALGVLSLFAFPIGTFIGALTIWYLIKPEVVAEFEG